MSSGEKGKKIQLEGLSQQFYILKLSFRQQLNRIYTIFMHSIYYILQVQMDIDKCLSWNK